MHINDLPISLIETVRKVFEEAPMKPHAPADPSRDSLYNFRNQWDDVGVKNFAYHNAPTNVITLSKLVVPSDMRNQGIGTKYMQDLNDHADRHGATIVLTPSNDFGGTKSRLIVFYKRHGFVLNKGKEKDFSHMYSMYRKPVVITEGVTQEEEGWMHISHRQSMTPLKHVNAIIDAHKELGWVMSDSNENHVMYNPLTNRTDGSLGVERTVRMKHYDGRKVNIRVKFAGKNNHDHTSYSINRYFEIPN